MSNEYYVYILTNRYNTVLYVGVTNDLLRRIKEHKDRIHPGFTLKYRITKLVYFETTEDVEAAIVREKQLKAGNREKKIRLINALNPDWRDLSDEFG